VRILLVEDEERVARFVVRELLAERFAVDAATEYQYDLIILDPMLSGMSGGTEILRRLRRGNPNVPLLILTAQGRTAEQGAELLGRRRRLPQQSMPRTWVTSNWTDCRKRPIPKPSWAATIIEALRHAGFEVEEF
jgi:CheY-like chemotaxis protein